jgi:hypothetical protein
MNNLKSAASTDGVTTSICGVAARRDIGIRSLSES